MAAITLPDNLETFSPREKAQVYNSLISQGFSDTAVRNAVESKLGKQSNGDWGALKDLASIVKATGQADQGGAFTTNFGDANSWKFGEGAEYNEKNMIESPGSYFERGNDVIVSDELFWNPDSPLGEELAQKIDDTKEANKRAGVVITPYAVFQGKATNEQLLEEVKRSGADFVAIDPYVGFGVPEEQLLEWTKNFVPQLNSLGVGVKLVLQDFARTGQEAETNAYNRKLLETPGISEFISFGLEDAKDLQGSPDWTSLTGGQQFQPASQQQAQSTTAAASGGLMSQGSPAMVGPQLPAQFANLTPEQRTQMLMAATSGLDIPMSQAQVPLGQVGDTFYTLTSNGIIAGTPDPSGVGAQQQMYDANNQLVENAFLPRFGASNPVTNAFVGGTLGLMLGPAVLGLSAPAAAAIAAGAPRLNETGNLTEAAKAAALAGLTAYGAQSLFGGAGAAPSSIADDFVAADVAQLAAQGIPEEQIADILMRSGVSAQTAAAALDAQFGTSAPGAARGLGDFSSTTPNAVNVTGTSLFNPAAAIAPSLGGAISTLPSTAPSPNRVEIPGSRLPTENLTVDDLLAALSPAITGALPPVTGGTTQQVGVTGSREPPASTTPGATGGAAGSALVPTATAPTQQVTTTGTRDTGSSALGGAAGGALGGILAGIQPAIPTATDRVEVPGKREPGGGTLPAVVGATLPTIPSTITQPLPEVVKPPAAKEESLFTPSDILKLLTLLGGGAAAGSMTGGGNVPVRGLPPSDTLIGSTTPQFGSDYYAAVQRYYNAFMPETPRNVAGPLQQWYENKFGA